MFDVSIIIPCKNEINNLKKTIDSIMSSKNKLTYEIIVIDDGCVDGSCDFISTDVETYKNIKLIPSGNLGLSNTKNLGGKTAQGKYLFFCDAHITVPDYWLDNLIKTLEENGGHAIAPVVADMTRDQYKGYGETWNSSLEVVWLTNKPENNSSEIPIACGCVFGIKKEVFDAIGGFDSHFEIWGKEDEEISLKLWLFGYRIILDTFVEVKHLFRTKHPYEVTHENVIYNFLCMVYSHFDTKNLAIALDIARNKYSFAPAIAKIMLNGDLMNQRKEYFSRRTFNENYFFEKFDIPFK
jgi:glycosyltransferase involved in cell wall biosynthesis